MFLIAKEIWRCLERCYDDTVLLKVTLCSFLHCNTHQNLPWLVQLSYELFFSYSTFLLKYSWFTMLCHSLLHSKVTYLHTYIHCFYILFYYDLSRDTKYSLLCYTLESCHLRILNVIYQPQICISFPSFPHP